MGGPLGSARLAVALLATCAVAAPGQAAADLPSSLTASCELRDAADGSTTNGPHKLPFRFCDDGVPSSGGREPNVGAVKAVAVPALYDGHEGLPAKAAGAAAMPGAAPDGTVALDVDLTLPDPGLNPMPPEGYPLMVMMHGCCSGDKTGGEAATVDAAGSGGRITEAWHYNNAWFAARGYVVLTYTARGFVNGSGDGSTGETQLDSRSFEINDYQHLAGDVADEADLDPDPARTVKVDGQRVVTTGGSYGGGFSWLALTDPTWQSPDGRPMRLAASAPKYGWSDLVYSLVPNGTHMRDALPPATVDGSASAAPFGFPKQSIVGGLYVSGKTGLPTEFKHTTFPAYIDQGFVCLQSSDPYESNPLCTTTLQQTLPAFLRERSSYYQDAFFSRTAADPGSRVPVFSAGTFTDPLFTAVEHRRMVDRLKATVPDYPVQEYHGDYQHFVQNKAKEWGDVCGGDRHVCTYGDYPGGNLNADPAELRRTGVTSMLNDFIDYYAKPPGRDPNQPEPQRNVTASLQICPANAATAGFPQDEPGERFTAARFDQLAPNTLRIEVQGSQPTTSKAAPNEHALTADPVADTVAKERLGQRPGCPTHPAPGGAATAGPGVATYDSPELPRDFTMIGRTRVTVPHTGAGGGLQLNARLYDLFPDGKQVMVDRGVRRLTDANATTVFDLHGNGWRFPRGHKVRIELAQDDSPYIKSSTQPSALTLSRVTLEIPIREPSATLAAPPRRVPSARREKDGRRKEPSRPQPAAAAAAERGDLPFTGLALASLLLLGLVLVSAGMALRRAARRERR